MKNLKRIVFAVCLVVFVCAVGFSNNHAESTTIISSDSTEHYQTETKTAVTGSKQVKLTSGSKETSNSEKLTQKSATSGARHNFDFLKNTNPTGADN